MSVHPVYALLASDPARVWTAREVIAALPDLPVRRVRTYLASGTRNGLLERVPLRRETRGGGHLPGGYRVRRLPSRGISLSGSSAQLLRVACAEPLPLAELLDRLDRRGVILRRDTALAAAARLEGRGLLAVTRQAQGRANLYTLTPAGEDALEALWR